MVHGWSVTVASTDTLTVRLGNGVHPWMVHRWSVTVVHPWMVHGWSMDGHSNCSIPNTLTDGVRQGVHPWMATVTVASTDTLTDGVRQGVHPWMVHG